MNKICSLTSSYDPEEKKLYIKYTGDKLVKKYEDLFAESTQTILPEAMKTCWAVQNGAVIFKVDLLVSTPEIASLNSDKAMQFLKTSKNSPLVYVVDTINHFHALCMNRISKTKEIIPLSGYPEENVRQDIETAIKMKRDICVVDTYNSYLEFNKGKTFDMNQITFTYMSPEYNDFAIDTMVNGLKWSEEKYLPCLKVSSWLDE